MSLKKQERFYKSLKENLRLKYESENKYKWLVDLLDAYHLIDIGVDVEIKSQTKHQKRNIACYKGCYSCCLNPDVPLNQIELQGLLWYVSEVLEEEIYNRLIPQLLNHGESAACCFLLDGICSVYPVRPIACRIFYVFDKSCEPLEDVSKTRYKDIVHAHKKEISWMVSQKLMPHMGIAKNDLKKQFEDGYMFKNTRSLYTFDWTTFKTTTEHYRANH